MNHTSRSLRAMNPPMPSEKETLVTAADMLDAIDALHRTEVMGTEGSTRYWCDCLDCGQTWPCQTHRILHPEDGE